MTTMDMKGHILTGMREMYDRWEAMLAGLSAEQITTPFLPSEWTTKDILAHVRAWQQRSIARFEAALSNQEPDYPRWLPGVDPDAPGVTDQMNAWIYEANRDLPWSVVHQNWRDTFLHLLELGERISEIDLLDTGKYPWMKGYPLVLILLFSYDHHKEHYEKLQAYLQEHGMVS